MSVMRCEMHDLRWDSDLAEKCPLCDAKLDCEQRREAIEVEDWVASNIEQAAHELVYLRSFYAEYAFVKDRPESH